MIQGFFPRKETEQRVRPDGRTYTCVSCGLYKDCLSPKMEPFGKFRKKILNIGEAPGEVEDKTNKPFQGKTGQLLQRTYKKLGVDLFEDCLNINAVHCRPFDKNGYNRTPTNYEIECCRKSTLKVIDEYKPEIIILLGNSAIYSLIGHRWKKDLGGVSKWRGWTIPDQDFKAWICPTFHPSYVERSDSGVEETVWKNDLNQAFLKVLDKLPIYKEPRIETITDLYMLVNIRGEVAIDFETTGLKPHAPGHRIVSCSVAPGPDHAYVFMLPGSQSERKPLIDLLASTKIGKIAQNIKYEHNWSKVRLKTEVQNWIWDTMQASHVLDNRPGVTGLKFQTYVQFGVVDYSSEIEPYLQAVDGTNANSLNKIMELVSKPGGKEKLLTYNGYDSINTYRLSMIQRPQINLPF